jgi:hypothetical protein
LNGSNAYPEPLKNLFWNSTQWRRRQCKKHSIQSINIITAKVTDQKTGHIMNDGIIVPRMTKALFEDVPQIVKILTYYLRIRLKNTSES